MMSQYARNALMPPRNFVAPSKQQEPRRRRDRSSAAAAVAATRRLAPALPSLAHSLPTNKVVVQRNTTEPELSQLSSDTFSAVSYSTPPVESSVPMPRTGTGILTSVRDKQRSRYSTSTAQPYSFHSSSGSTLTSRTSKKPWALPQLLVDPSFGSRRLPSSEDNTESGTFQGSRSIQTAPNSSSSSVASSRRTGGLNSIPLCQESVASSGASVSRRNTRTMEMHHHPGTPIPGRAANSASSSGNSSRFSRTSDSREGTTGQSILSYPSSRRLATSSQSTVASASASSTNRQQLPGTPRRPSSVEYQIQLAVQSQLQQTLEKHEQELMQKFAAQFGSTTENSVNQEQLDQFIQEQRVCMQEQLEMERRKLEQVLQSRLSEYDKAHAKERQEHKTRLEQQHASHLQEIQSVLTHVQELAHAQDQANQDHLGQMTQIQAQVETHANKATGLLDRAEAAADKITDMVDSALASLPSMVQSIANKFLLSNQESDQNLTPETNKSSKGNAEISKKRSSKDRGRKPVDHSQTTRIIAFSQGSPSSSVTTASKERRQRRISPPSQTSLRVDDQPSVSLTQENSPLPSSSLTRTPARRTKKRSVVSSTKSSTKHSKKKKTSSFAPLELLDTTNLSCVTPKAATPQTPRVPSFAPKVSHSVRSKRPKAASRSRRRQGDGGKNDPITVSSNDTKRRRHKTTRRPVSKKPPHVVQNDFSFLSDLSD